MRVFLSILFSVLLLGESQAQIESDRDLPFALSAENVNLDSFLKRNESTVRSISIDAGDLSQLHIEDSIAALNKDQGYRFGVAIDSTINVLEIASKLNFSNYTEYQLIVRSPGAYSINLNFDQFYLPEGSRFYIRSLHEKDLLGALGSQNNKADRQFSIRPMKGDAIQLSLYIPKNRLDSANVQISQVIHAYKDLFQKSRKTFNSSGNCNRNTNCPEADLWQDVKRSVVLILASNNTRLCTGTLINNVRQDSTPYLLTASHCNLATNSVFVFGYENGSTNCLTNVDGSLSNSISGAISRAENNYSDFRSFELSSTPPASYNPYYAGWDASGIAPLESTTIHHPSGDIKKISRDVDTSTSAAYTPPNSDTHWQVGNWESGTTEPGSSGAAQFDQFKRVVGQLEGGSASCSSNLEDLFGKFSLSWNFNSMSNRQLKVWLDPDNTNQLVLDGMDPISKSNSNDLELTYVSNVSSFLCDTMIQATAHFMNVGNNAITSVSVQYGTNGQYNNTVSWTGNIGSDELASQLLNPLSVSASDTVFNVRVVISPSDQDTSNNSWSKPIKVNDRPITIGFELNTDEYGNETSWEIVDSQNRILHKGGPYVIAPDTSGITYYDSLCLFDGCFDFILYDGVGDGFSSSFFGYGYVLLTAPNGDTLLYEANFTGSQKTINFCVIDTTTSLVEIKNNKRLNVYPNPIEKGELLQIRQENSDYTEIQLIDLSGRIVLQARGTEIRIPTDLDSGMYILQVRGSDKAFARTKILIH